MVYFTETIDEFLKDYEGKYYGLRKALTTERDELFKQCDPECKEDLYLIGLPEGNWKVRALDHNETRRAATRIRLPSYSINAARRMFNNDEEWLLSVALPSYVSLKAVALIYVRASGLQKADRKEFIANINKLPPLDEIVREHQAKNPSGHEETLMSSSSMESEMNSEVQHHVQLLDDAQDQRW